MPLPQFLRSPLNSLRSIFRRDSANDAGDNGRKRQWFRRRAAIAPRYPQNNNLFNHTETHNPTNSSEATSTGGVDMEKVKKKWTDSTFGGNSEYALNQGSQIIETLPPDRSIIYKESSQEESNSDHPNPKPKTTKELSALTGIPELFILAAQAQSFLNGGFLSLRLGNPIDLANYILRKSILIKQKSCKYYPAKGRILVPDGVDPKEGFVKVPLKRTLSEILNQIKQDNDNSPENASKMDLVKIENGIITLKSANNDIIKLDLAELFSSSDHMPVGISLEDIKGLNCTDFAELTKTLSPHLNSLDQVKLTITQVNQATGSAQPVYVLGQKIGSQAFEISGDIDVQQYGWDLNNSTEHQEYFTTQEVKKDDIFTQSELIEKVANYFNFFCQKNQEKIKHIKAELEKLQAELEKLPQENHNQEATHQSIMQRIQELEEIIKNDLLHQVIERANKIEANNPDNKVDPTVLVNFLFHFFSNGDLKIYNDDNKIASIIDKMPPLMAHIASLSGKITPAQFLENMLLNLTLLDHDFIAGLAEQSGQQFDQVLLNLEMFFRLQHGPDTQNPARQEPADPSTVELVFFNGKWNYFSNYTEKLEFLLKPEVFNNVFVEIHPADISQYAALVAKQLDSPKHYKFISEDVKEAYLEYLRNEINEIIEKRIVPDNRLKIFSSDCKDLIMREKLIAICNIGRSYGMEKMIQELSTSPAKIVNTTNKESRRIMP